MTEQDLVAALRESDAFVPELSLVAEADGVLAGHILLTRASVGDSVQLALAPLSVLPRYQRQGIGQALVRAGHEKARALGYGYVIVLGSDTYYPKMGYVPADTYGIQSPFPVPRENFMACKLWDGAPAICGPVRYADAFGV